MTRMISQNFEISQGKAQKLRVGDRVKVLVLGEIQALEGLKTIGGDFINDREMPTDVLNATVEIKVSSTKVTRREKDDNAETFAAMSMDEDEEEEV